MQASMERAVLTESQLQNSSNPRHSFQVQSITSLFREKVKKKAPLVNQIFAISRNKNWLVFKALKIMYFTSGLDKWVLMETSFTMG